jgi:hypothetical protein
MMFRPLYWQRRIFLVAAVTAVLTGAACRPKADPVSEFTVEREITPLPVLVGPVRITFTVRDRASKPVEGAQVSVEADMSHAGMSPVFTEAKEIQPGRYQADLTVGMAGDWVILFHGTLASGEKLERQFEMKGVQPRALN